MHRKLADNQLHSMPRWSRSTRTESSRDRCRKSRKSPRTGRWETQAPPVCESWASQYEACRSWASWWEGAKRPVLRMVIEQKRKHRKLADNQLHSMQKWSRSIRIESSRDRCCKSRKSPRTGLPTPERGAPSVQQRRQQTRPGRGTKGGREGWAWLVFW